MTKILKQVECPPECGFLVRSHDERELIDIVSSHAKNIHGVTDYTESDIRAHMKTVGRQEPMPEKPRPSPA
jgi:predicted small metal-binding protein